MIATTDSGKDEKGERITSYKRGDAPCIGHFSDVFGFLCSGCVIGLFSGGHLIMLLYKKKNIRGTPPIPRQGARPPAPPTLFLSRAVRVPVLQRRQVRCERHECVARLPLNRRIARPRRWRRLRQDREVLAYVYPLLLFWGIWEKNVG